MITSALAILALAGSPLAQEEATIAFEAPTIHIAGQSYPVKIDIQAGTRPAPLAAWLFDQSAFLVDGESLGTRTADQFITLPAGAKLALEFDLGPYLPETGDFELTYAKNVYQEGPLSVKVLEVAAEEVDFMTADVETLGDYMVAMTTNRGTMLMEMWPDVAPNHVRNFLDLAHSSFYDQVLFHRVGPGFMIQGGDPLTKDPAQKARWGSGDGPRKLQAEFSDKPHVRGTLSTARSNDPNSASCQFFVMHAKAAFLDGKYTVFGQLVPDHSESFRALDAIATAEGRPNGDGTFQPSEPQRIERAAVVVRPSVTAGGSR